MTPASVPPTAPPDPPALAAPHPMSGVMRHTPGPPTFHNVVEPVTAALTDRLMAEVYVHLDRSNNAPNDAVRFAEHAQALGLLTAIEIIKEMPCSTTT